MSEAVALTYEPIDITPPLYVSIDDAAVYAGINKDQMRAYANAKVDPIPHIRIGKSKKLIRKAAIGPYMRTKEAV